MKYITNTSPQSVARLLEIASQLGVPRRSIHTTGDGIEVSDALFAAYHASVQSDPLPLAAPNLICGAAIRVQSDPVNPAPPVPQPITGSHEHEVIESIIQVLEYHGLAYDDTSWHGDDNDDQPHP